MVGQSVPNRTRLVFRDRQGLLKLGPHIVEIGKVQLTGDFLLDDLFDVRQVQYRSALLEEADRCHIQDAVVSVTGRSKAGAKPQPVFRFAQFWQPLQKSYAMPGIARLARSWAPPGNEHPWLL